MTRRRVHALAVAVVTAAFTLSSVSSAPAAQLDPLAATRATVATLPAPYSGWNVEITRKTDEEGALTLKYSSPALGMRTTNTVYLPDSYRASGGASPVMYYLHGTVIPPIDNPVLDPVTGLESLLDMTSAGGGSKQTKLFDFGSQRAKAKFLVVAPDTNTKNSWCQSCMWINGRDDLLPNLPPVTAVQRPAEDVLYEELVPLVERVFNVRTTREGRGVIGFSMGGVSAMIHGFRHPDRYAFVGSVSGPYDFADDLGILALIEGLGHMRDQGYGTRLTNGVDWANVNPRDLVGNFAGSGGTLLLSAGDICLPATDAQGGLACTKYPGVTNPAAAAAELLVRRNIDLSISQLSSAGVHATQIRHSGVHGANNARVYAEDIVGRANQTFASAPTMAPTFSYRTADKDFSVWDYSVSTTRTATEFLALENARRDGSSFSLRGRGTVQVSTPPTFTAGNAYPVTISSAKGEVSRQSVAADSTGRLRITVPLNGSASISIVAT